MVRRGHEAMMVGVLLAGSLLLPRGAQASKEGKGGPPTSHAERAAPGAKAKGPAHGQAAKAAGQSKGPDDHGRKGPPAGQPSAPGLERAAARAERAEFKSAVAELRERQAQGKL
ncbi:MAG TPA: hypothetical protein VJU61_27835, partial [Polyangiaceae bacterium]|nr:hypothetical protein [Polyangiaceae bacterium]